MKEIWKFPIEMGANKIEMPNGAVVLTVQLQNDIPCLWAIVNPEEASNTRVFHIHGTGHPLEVAPRDYVGTFQQGPFVWHVFEGT